MCYFTCKSNFLNFNWIFDCFIAHLCCVVFILLLLMVFLFYIHIYTIYRYVCICMHRYKTLCCFSFIIVLFICAIKLMRIKFYANWKNIFFFYFIFLLHQICFYLIYPPICTLNWLYKSKNKNNQKKQKNLAYQYAPLECVCAFKGRCHTICNGSSISQLGLHWQFDLLKSNKIYVLQKITQIIAIGYIYYKYRVLLGKIYFYSLVHFLLKKKAKFYPINIAYE